MAQPTVENTPWLLWFCVTLLCDCPKNLAALSQQIRFKPTVTWSPAFHALCQLLLCVLTGWQWCLPSLSLAIVITLVFVLRKSSKNCSITFLKLRILWRRKLCKNLCTEQHYNFSYTTKKIRKLIYKLSCITYSLQNLTVSNEKNDDTVTLTVQLCWKP